tara:strand:- start:396 stop:641 length:246 start_codon:yes stop_codon:yes gene_type:complete
MTKRVLTVQIKHETNTFSVLPATSVSYRARPLLEGVMVGKNLAGTNNEIAGATGVAEAEGWDLTTAFAADATPSGKVSREA